jgi:hypothetical protein
MAAWAWLWLCLVPLGYGGSWLGAACLLAVLGLVPLGYWLSLAWHRLGLAVNGYGLAIAAWLWPLGLGY